jgi:hypothetical protein
MIRLAPKAVGASARWQHMAAADPKRRDTYTPPGFPVVPWFRGVSRLRRYARRGTGKRRDEEPAAMDAESEVGVNDGDDEWQTLSPLELAV